MSEEAIVEEDQPKAGNPNELIQYLASNLVNTPEDVSLECTLASGSYDIALTVNDNEIGSVIGKNGRVAKAMRVLISSMSLENYVDDDGDVVRRANLEIVDNNKN